MNLRRTLPITLLAFAAGCGHGLASQQPGPEAGMDGSELSEAGSTPAPEAALDDAATTSHAVDPCDGGYFVEMDSGDAGTRLLLTSGCSDAGSDAGPNVPFAVNSVCGEDYPCTLLSACQGPASLTFQSYAGNSGATSFCGVGLCTALATYSDGDGGILEGNAALQIATFPGDGGMVGGQYVATWTVVVDGSTSTVTASGEFCVLYVP
jgi:hypothetical protein